MNLLQIEDLHLQLGGQRILQGVNLQVAQGERLALIGPNGAGKSSLFNVISGRVQPQSGRIDFDGRSLLGQPAHEIVRAGVGRSFQISQLFARLSVEEHLRMACLSPLGYQAGRWPDLRRRLSRLSDVTERVETLLLALDLGHVRHLPAAQLPYARQRVLELALVAALDPRLMLLDEPSAGLSRSETEQLVERIDRLAQGRTLLLVEHDMSVVQGLADRVAVLHEGRVLICDRPQAVRDHPQVQAVYLAGRSC